MTAGVPAGSRKSELVQEVEVGEEMHECGYCGTRTELDDGLYYATGARNHDCPHCGQRYILTDEEGDDGYGVSLEGEGEIEVVDEHTGEVVGMTSDTSDLDDVLHDLAPDEALEASVGDLDHLFGKKPSPYGDDFGCF